MGGFLGPIFAQGSCKSEFLKRTALPFPCRVRFKRFAHAAGPKFEKNRKKKIAHSHFHFHFGVGSGGPHHRVRHKKDTDSWIQIDFCGLEKRNQYFHPFPMPGSCGNPRTPGIDSTSIQKKHVLGFVLIRFLFFLLSLHNP